MDYKSNSKTKMPTYKSKQQQAIIYKVNINDANSWWIWYYSLCQTPIADAEARVRNGVGVTFLRWYPPSTMWAGPFSLCECHHKGWLNNPIVSNFLVQFFLVQFFIAIWNTIMIHKAQLTAMVTCIIPIWNKTSLSKFTKQVNSWDSVTAN